MKKYYIDPYSYVMTRNGLKLAISLLEGDLLLNSQNQYVKIEKVIEPEKFLSKNIKLSTQISLNIPLKTEILTTKGFKKIHKVTYKDNLILENNVISDSTDNNIAHNVEIKGKSYFVNLPRFATKENSFVFGVFAAKGSFDKDGDIMFDISNKIASLKQMILTEFKKVFNITLTEYDYGDKKFLGCKSIALAKYFSYLFNMESSLKKIPVHIFTSDTECKLAFIKGCSLDGGMNNSNIRVCTSSSKRFIHELNRLILSLGDYARIEHNVNNFGKKYYNLYMIKNTVINVFFDSLVKDKTQRIPLFLPVLKPSDEKYQDIYKIRKKGFMNAEKLKSLDLSYDHKYIIESIDVSMKTKLVNFIGILIESNTLLLDSGIVIKPNS